MKPGTPLPVGKPHHQRDSLAAAANGAGQLVFHNFRDTQRKSGGPGPVRGDRRGAHDLLGAELVRDLVSIIQRAEADNAVRVLVFKSADADYCISHVDVTRIKEYRHEAAKLTGEPSIALLFRHLSASRLVSIAQIEGRVRAAGSEFVLACDMRFAARESAIFSQPELAGPAIRYLTGSQGASTALGRLGRLERPRIGL